MKVGMNQWTNQNWLSKPITENTFPWVIRKKLAVHGFMNVIRSHFQQCWLIIEHLLWSGSYFKHYTGYTLLFLYQICRTVNKYAFNVVNYNNNKNKTKSIFQISFGTLNTLENEIPLVQWYCVSFTTTPSLPPSLLSVVKVGTMPNSRLKSSTVNNIENKTNA